MQIKKWSLWLSMALSCHLMNAQNPTKILLNLETNDKNRLEVKVFPPADKNEWRFVIPEIIPGTYMKINYERFYGKIYAYGVSGEKLKVKKNDNVYTIKGDEPLAYLSYEINQTLGDGKIWDNILACAGTIFTEESYLLNFQLISGYFDGFEDHPYQVDIEKKENLYAATSLKALSSNSSKDVFTALNYDNLIDQPILYAQADTTSFEIRENKFHIAVHSETDKVNANMLKPRLTKIMHAVDSFSGFTSAEDYHFVFYYVNKDRLKGLFKTFGMGSALEHHHSSFYYFSEAIYDSTFSNLDWIGAHEYFHTITPLSLHSEKIHDFNFETPDMSRHGWLYEGVTDYFAALLSAQHDLNNSIVNNMRWAVYTAEKQKPRSFTQSSEDIIKKNMFSWVGKIGQLGNYYERGKLVALGLDMMIYEKSNGEKRLIDVMLEMKRDFEGKAFDDDSFFDLLTKYTYPEVREFCEKYIEGKELVPYQDYFDKLGWSYFPKGTESASYGNFNVWYKEKEDHYYVNWQKKNNLGLMKGDIVISFNGIKLDEKQAASFYKKAFYPELSDQITLTVLRDGKTFTLEGTAKKTKLKYARITVTEDLTPEQKAYRKGFYKE